MSTENILELKQICKEFPGVKALDDVSFSIRKGEVHALLGENGAGKSTLIKIISGVYHADAGEIVFDGKPFEATSPSKSIDMGISTVHQELKMVETLTAAENIFMGHPIQKNTVIGKTISKRKMVEKSQQLIDAMGVAINATDIVGDLSVAKKQIVEICKALNRNAKLIIMDEPSATLTEAEIQVLFQAIRKLRQENVTVIYISHRLEEIFELADRLTILRDGKSIITGDVKDFDRNRLIQHMVGREITSIYPQKSMKKGAKVLEVKGLTTQGVLRDISFNLHSGEILGITGLVGSGRTEVLRAIFGADKFDAGEVLVGGKKTKKKHTVVSAIKYSIGLVPEERKVEGIIHEFSVAQNITLVGISKVMRKTLLSKKVEAQVSDEYIRLLRVATPHRSTLVKNLSGGNQQKVVIAKWLFINSDILLFDEPTRGIDVGAKQEIYKILVNLAEQGKAVLIVSSELPEVLGICNRVLVMHDGRITAELNCDETSQEEIMYAATL